MGRRRYGEGQNRVFMPEQIRSVAESVYNAVDVFTMRRNMIDAPAFKLLHDWKRDYYHVETCQQTVTKAITAILEG